NTRASAPAAFALPYVFAEVRGAVGLLQGGADAILQGAEVVGGTSTHGSSIGNASTGHREPVEWRSQKVVPSPPYSVCRRKGNPTRPSKSEWLAFAAAR